VSFCEHIATPFGEDVLDAVCFYAARCDEGPALSLVPWALLQNSRQLADRLAGQLLLQSVPSGAPISQYGATADRLLATLDWTHIDPANPTGPLPFDSAGLHLRTETVFAAIVARIRAADPAILADADRLPRRAPPLPGTPAAQHPEPAYPTCCPLIPLPTRILPAPAAATAALRLPTVAASSVTLSCRCRAPLLLPCQAPPLLCSCLACSCPTPAATAALRLPTVGLPTLSRCYRLCAAELLPPLCRCCCCHVTQAPLLPLPLPCSRPAPAATAALRLPAVLPAP
jgi:hypothetical protein